MVWLVKAGLLFGASACLVMVLTMFAALQNNGQVMVYTMRFGEGVVELVVYSVGVLVCVSGLST